MIVTILAEPMFMLAYFLLLYGAVAFIQDKCFLALHPRKTSPQSQLRRNASAVRTRSAEAS